MSALLAIDSGQTGIKVRLPDGAPRTFPGIRTNQRLLPQLAEVVHESALGGAGPLELAIGTTGLTKLEANPTELLELCRADGVERVALAHDSVTSFLGAMGYQTGVVVAAGTGVVTLGVGPTAVSRVDGWGNLIGDAGSGFWIGRAGLDAVMRAFDGRGQATALTAFAEAEFSALDNAYIELQTDPGHVRRIGSFAKYVSDLAATDPVCARICEQAGAELATSVAAAAKNVGLDVPQVALLGGVFRSPAIREACVAALRMRWPGFQPAEPLGDILDGAAALASLPAGHPLAAQVLVAAV
ncbi:MAG: ATPase [Propionibacteriaceae bacterium]|jgi:N-acetylglucosamine kinase-like BadF-type ATPase|nr:ATPase [Propionibacteriaceae bacterium]